jgi:type VI secretion system secreted protein VgrG
VRTTFVLQKSYPVLEYCVEYRETEFNFISRLMQEAGIGFFFEHKASNHVMVMCDGVAAQASMPGEATVIFHRAGCMHPLWFQWCPGCVSP